MTCTIVHCNGTNMSGITRGITGSCLVCPTITLLFLSINFYQFLVHGHGQGEQIHSYSLVSWPEMMSGGGGGISSSGQGVRRLNLVGCISSILLLFLALLIIPWYLLLLLLLSYLYLSLLCNSFFLCTLFPFLLSSLWILVPGQSTWAWLLARYHLVFAGVHLTRRVPPLSENNAGPLTAAGNESEQWMVEWRPRGRRGRDTAAAQSPVLLPSYRTFKNRLYQHG